MSTGRQDFQITANTAKQVNFALTDAGAPLDLTNAQMRWRMAQAIDDATATLEKLNTGSNPDIIVTNPSGGLCYVSIGDGDITDYGLFWHFLETNLGSAGWICVARGRVVVEPSIGPAA